ncbi:kinesin-like protein KIF9 [Spea bombifrons]|uniref:kinesin-like protein KIF9 n=1 Tax=Spea bombifrons TaxID=233779 RepID=UPI00234B868B|nr:kinesin-like protein KIF9 [Spea bombifrons]
MSARSSTVKVFVRFRPTPNFAQDKIRLGEDHKTVEIHVKKDEKFGVVNNKRSDWSFKVDGVLNDASQDTVYNVVAKSVVSKALDGYNGTIMCYGQTGAGKTFTTTGSMENYQHRGIIPRALQQVFKEIEERSDLSVTVRISYLEIYNETLSDLLATSPDVPVPDQLTIVDDPQGVCVKGLSVHLAGTEEHALNLLFEGETNRIIGSHILNKTSSRSHCVFTVHLESHSRTLSDAKYTVSKINLVDLAGSERVGKTGSEGQVLKEAAYINKSLTFLEQAIMALSERGREHVPFRQSKLTHALRDSLGGSCSTILVANVYGEAAQIDETLSTLRFACRMKCIPVEPAAVERYNPLRVIKNLQKEVEHLKRELAVHDTLAGRTRVTHEPFSEAQIAEMNSQVRRYLDGTLEEIDIRNLRQIQEIFSQFRLIWSKQEQEVESRLRQKYPLIDKSDYPAVAGAQKAGLVDADGQLVGDLDGRSFSVGAAPHSSKPSSSLSARKPKSRKSKETSPTSRREGAASPSPSRDQEPASLAKPSLTSVSTKELEATVKELETAAPDGQPPDQPTKEETSAPGTPPPKQAAFEDFKADRGSELHAIFKENKTILADRRKKLKEITQRINMIKREIDVTSQDLNVTKLEREKQGEYISSEGQVIIDEKEFMLIIRLKDLKKQYRADYDELQDLRAEVQYCQKLVDRCRQRLFTEFECWYNECFVIPEELQTSLKGSVRPGLLPLRKVMSLGEDEQERNDELQKELLMEVPGALAFHAAKIKSDQKHNYSKAVARLPAAKRRPGLITASMKNRPPSTLVAV